MGNEKAYADLQAAVAEQVAALTEQRGLGFASDKESWADLRKRVEECDDLLKNIKNVQKDMWKAIRENDPDAYGALAAELVRESMTMTTNWLGIAAASKVAAGNDGGMTMAERKLPMGRQGDRWPAIARPETPRRRSEYWPI